MRNNELLVKEFAKTLAHYDGGKITSVGWAVCGQSAKDKAPSAVTFMEESSSNKGLMTFIGAIYTMLQEAYTKSRKYERNLR